MAGIVKADVMHGLPGQRRAALMPRACPCMSQSNRPLCVEASEQSAWINLCPFLYGIRTRQGGSIADLRCTEDMRNWLFFDSAHERSWEVLCLRRESANTEAGARLRD